MKKIKSLLLAGLLTATSLLGGTAISKVEVIADVKLNEKISSFETVEEYYTFEFGGRFGKVNVNTDKEFITDGEASMKMEVWGQVHKTGVDGPNVEIALSKSGSIDASRLKNFTFDLFNQTGEARTIEAALKIDGTVSEYQKIDLTTGKNSLTVAFDVVGLAVGFDMTKTQALVIRFPIASSYEAASQQIYYLDNLQMNMNLVAPSPLKIVMDEGEFCSFEKPYQKYVTKAGGVGPTVGCQPILSLNDNLEYCANNTGKSLRVELPTGIAPLNDGWPNWTFIDAMFESVDWAQMAKEGKKFVFDVYNTGSYFRFGFEIGAKSGSKARGWSTGVDCYSGWNTISIDMTKWNDNQTDEEGEYPNPLTENIHQIVFSYSKFAGENKVFYFDNFRFE